MKLKCSDPECNSEKFEADFKAHEVHVVDDEGYDLEILPGDYVEGPTGDYRCAECRSKAIDKEAECKHEPAPGFYPPTCKHCGNIIG